MDYSYQVMSMALALDLSAEYLSVMKKLIDYEDVGVILNSKDNKWVIDPEFDENMKKRVSEKAWVKADSNSILTVNDRRTSTWMPFQTFQKQGGQLVRGDELKAEAIHRDKYKLVDGRGNMLELYHCFHATVEEVTNNTDIELSYDYCLEYNVPEARITNRDREGIASVRNSIDPNLASRIILDKGLEGYPDTVDSQRVVRGYRVSVDRKEFMADENFPGIIVGKGDDKGGMPTYNINYMHMMETGRPHCSKTGYFYETLLRKNEDD